MEFLINPGNFDFTGDDTGVFQGLGTSFHDANLAKSCSSLRNESCCLICNKVGHFTCSACGEAQYCSRNCQRADWQLHKALCTTLKDFTNDKAPEPFDGNEWRRAVVFPQDANNAEWIWLRSAGHFFKASPNRCFAGLAPLIQAPSSTYVTTGIINTSPRFAALHRQVGHVLLETSLGDARLTLSFRNNSLVNLCGSAGHAMLRFGPVLLSAFNHANATLENVSMRDFTNAAMYFRTHEYNPVVIGDPKKFPCPTAPAIKLNSVVRKRSQASGLSGDRDDAEARLFLLGMPPGRDIELVYIPLEAGQRVQSFRSAFPAKLSLDWWVRPGGSASMHWMTDTERNPLSLTHHARHILRVVDSVDKTEEQQRSTDNLKKPAVSAVGTNVPANSHINEKHGRQSDYHAVVRALEEVDAEVKGGQHLVSDVILPVNSAVLLYRPDGHRIYAAHLFALNEFIDSIGPNEAATAFTRGGFEAFWAESQRSAEVNMLSLAGVPSPYDGPPK